MNRLRRWVVALLLSATAATGFAQNPVCNDPKVYFVNGVLNDQWEAQTGSRALEAAISAGGGPRNLHITTLYNPTDPELGDAVEVGTDYILSRGYLNTAFFAAIVADALAVNSVVVSPRLFEVLLQTTGGTTFSSWLNRQITGVGASLRNEAVISRIHDTILATVRDSQRPVVVIAHSQGNFYVNEAIRRLKTSERTKDIPGIQAIGVLGLAVASRQDPGALPSGPDFYRYVTKTDDVVIGGLSAALPANFSNIQDARLSSVSLTRHELIKDYLYPLTTGSYGARPRVSVRTLVADLFNELYATTARSWPCITSTTTSPSPVNVGSPSTLRASVVTRGGVPVTRGSVAFSVDGTEVCAAAVNASGTSSCTYTFVRATSGRVQAQWRDGVLVGTPVDIPYTAADTYWSGTMQIDTCTSLPPDFRTQWLYENPCFTAGPSSGQYKGFIRFKDGDRRVVLGSNFGVAFIFTTEDYAATFDLDWKSTDPYFYFEVPRAAPAYTTLTGNRKVTLTVTSRTSTTITGRVNVESPFSVYYRYSNSDGGVLAPTTGVGTFTLQMKQGVIVYP